VISKPALRNLLLQKNASQIQSILTIPPIADLPEDLFTFKPKPVAAIWGAQQQQVLPATVEGPSHFGSGCGRISNNAVFDSKERGSNISSVGLWRQTICQQVSGGDCEGSTKSSK
jgi:hypothetical protein